MPFYFSAFELDFPLCTKSELLYLVRQSFSWQAAAQLGKLLGHSEMLGNPFGVIQGMGSGVAGAVRGVGGAELGSGSCQWKRGTYLRGRGRGARR